MQELEKILDEIEDERVILDDYQVAKGIMLARHWNNCIDVVKDIIRKHMNNGERFEFDFTNVKSFDCQCGKHYVNTGAENNDGWIPVDKELPEDLYTPSEMYEKWFLITTPFGEEKVVQRTRCVPTGYVWFDGYDSVRVSAWRYIKPYRPERSDGE